LSGSQVGDVYGQACAGLASGEVPIERIIGGIVAFSEGSGQACPESQDAQEDCSHLIGDVAH